MAKKEKKKIKIPNAVKGLGMSPRKFAKKNNIRLKGKGVTKREKKRNRKKLVVAYSEAALNGLNKGVKIISENSQSESKKLLKVKDNVDKIISSPEVMKRIAKLYSKNPKNYPNMIFLPHMIMNTLIYYNQEGLSDEEKDIAETLDKDGLVKFCEKVLKDEIRRYRKLGIPHEMAYQLATVVPTTKLLRSNRNWYRKLIQSLYMIAEEQPVDLKDVLTAVQKIDKKKSIEKKDFYEDFFSAFILSKSSNKNNLFNDSQKDLHETLIDSTLDYLDGLKKSRIKDILKNYIRNRKKAESYKNDTKRVIKFIDQANSNSSYTNLKSVIQELISDNSSNEIYLS